MSNWFDNGCGACRQNVLSGEWDGLALRAESIARHARLWRCPACGAWWEEGEREAHVIDEAEARRNFPDHVPPRS